MIEVDNRRLGLTIQLFLNSIHSLHTNKATRNSCRLCV